MSTAAQPSGTGFSGGLYMKLTDGTYQLVIDENGDVVAGVSPGDLTLTNAHILVGNASNVATDVAVSGNATISNAGAISVTGLTIASQAAGDILYFNGTAWIRLAKGTAGQVLTMNGGATAPIWA